METMNRWVSKHKTAGFLLLALILCGLYTFVFISLQMPPLLILFLNLLLVVVAYLYSQGCYAQIVNKAIKTLNEQCDPYPLLEETATFLSHSNKEYHRQMLTINHCAALIEIGQFQKAYQLMSAINIDQCKEMVPLYKAVYYQNLFTICDELGQEEAAKIWLSKGNQLYSSIKPSAAKKKLEVNIVLNNVHYNKEYDQALESLQALPIPHLLAGVGIAMESARIYLAKGDLPKAKEALCFVVEKGNKLHIVEEAKTLLEQIN